MKKKTRYYMENGKYKQNKKFESWADEVTKMWKKVNIPQFKVTQTSCSTKAMWALGFVCLVYNPEQNTRESSK